MTSPAIAFGKSKEGVDYQSLDGQPAHLFFMIAAPEGGAQTHLDALAKLSHFNGRYSKRKSITG